MSVFLQRAPKCYWRYSRGQRRSVIVTLPFIASVDNAAQEARQTAFGPGLRADFHVLAMDTVVDEATHQWKISAAKPRPKRLKVVKAKTAADRMKAATAKPVGSGGKIMKNETPEEKAKAIFDLLRGRKSGAPRAYLGISYPFP